MFLRSLTCAQSLPVTYRRYLSGSLSSVRVSGNSLKSTAAIKWRKLKSSHFKKVEIQKYDECSF